MCRNSHGAERKIKLGKTVSLSRKTVQPSEDTAIRDYCIVFALLFGGVIIQTSGIWIIGPILIILGFWYYRSRIWSHGINIDFSPKLKTGKRWVSVTKTEMDKMRKKMQLTASFSKGCLVELFLGLVISFILYVGFKTFLRIVFGNFISAELDMQFFFNFALIFIIYFISFSPRTWEPNMIKFKLPYLENLISLLPKYRMGKWTREFQFELTDCEKGDVPTDIKMVLKPPDCPPAMYGIQAQLSQNRGGPYLYFVVITKPEMAISVPPKTDRDVLELKKTGEVNILVIRQFANKYGGYQTSGGDVERLLRLAFVSTVDTITKNQ